MVAETALHGIREGAAGLGVEKGALSGAADGMRACATRLVPCAPSPFPATGSTSAASSKRSRARLRSASWRWTTNLARRSWNPAPDDLGFVYVLLAGETGVHLEGGCEGDDTEERPRSCRRRRRLHWLQRADCWGVLGDPCHCPNRTATMGRRQLFERRRSCAGQSRRRRPVVRGPSRRLQGADSFGSVNALAIGGDALIVAGYPGGGNAGQLVVRPLRER